jgi:hypothetical protein
MRLPGPSAKAAEAKATRIQGTTFIGARMASGSRNTRAGNGDCTALDIPSRSTRS